LAQQSDVHHLQAFALEGEAHRAGDGVVVFQQQDGRSHAVDCAAALRRARGRLALLGLGG
jgi:hypothetical protein